MASSETTAGSVAPVKGKIAFWSLAKTVARLIIIFMLIVTQSKEKGLNAQIPEAPCAGRRQREFRICGGRD
jgi:hypothetical protein